MRSLTFSFKTIILVSLMTALVALNVNAQFNYPPVIDCDKEVVYKTIGDTELKLWIFYPAKYGSGDPLPAIVFFFGGGWSSGSPMQFVKHCEYLTERGMVAMVADYRVHSRHGVLAAQCVADAKSAVRYIRAHAAELGIDPGRIAAGGGSAGGHLAASTGTLPGFDEKDEDPTISSRPNAMALFNPVVSFSAPDRASEEDKQAYEKFQNRLGANPKEIAPLHNLKKGVPPTIIFHGTNDITVPISSVIDFNAQMKRLGNSSMLVAYENMGHGFFNFGRYENGPFISTLQYLDDFFVRLDWMDPIPNIQVY